MRILIATGGTGGHIFPALCVARILRERGHEVVFAGVLGLGEDQIMSAGFDLINIKAKGLSGRNVFWTMYSTWLMMLAIIRSIGIIRKIAPDKVIGFGGYGSFPIIFTAWMLRIPTMIHEQNVFPGKVNYVMGKLSKKIAVSFKKSSKFFNISKVVHTGCPCHSHKSIASKEELIIKFKLQQGKPTILVLGGSQGSQKINEVFFEFIKDANNASTLQALHMTGKREYAAYHQKYQELGLPVVACAFISNINDAYGVCDMIISRAGASCITEIGLLGIPSVIIPYPYASGHQLANASILKELEIAEVIEQSQLTVETLTCALKKTFNRRESKEVIMERAKDVIFSNAEQRLADVLEHL